MKKYILAVIMAAVSLAHCENVISVSPAGLSLKGHPGQVSTQVFKLSNLTNSVYDFTIEVTDVLVEDGKRQFVPANQRPGSLAALAYLPVTHVQLQPGAAANVPVTFGIPADTRIRAVAVFFRGREPQAGPGPRVQLNVGAVVDFSISDEASLEAIEPRVIPQSASTNAVVTEELANVGPEPVIVKGIAAILDAPGKLVGKAIFQQKRLLPGERNSVRAEYAGILAPGKYQVLCSLEYAGRTITRTTDFVIP